MSIFQKTITTSLSPNTEKDDVLLALGTLLTPWTWHSPKYVDELETAIKSYLDVKNVITFESGRTSLYSILTALKIGAEDEIVLQAYTCVAVPEPILWVGAKPVYVDIDLDTLNMSAHDLEKKITPKTKAIIIQYTFGNPSGLGKIIEIARKHNLYVIEDCAHALGAEYQGKKCGTFGDVAFFSYGRDKVISSVFGGMVVTSDKKFAEKIHDFKSHHCKKASRKWIAQQLLHPIIFALVKPLYTTFNLGKIILEACKRLGITSKAVYLEEKRGEKPPFLQTKLPGAMSRLALHQFNKINKVNTHRIALAGIYNHELKGQKIIGNEDKKDLKNIYLRFTILVDNPKAIHTAMKKRNIYLGDWYNYAIAPAGVNYEKIYYNPSGCPNAEKAAAMTINFPTHIGIKEKDAKYIIKVFNDISNQRNY